MKEGERRKNSTGELSTKRSSKPSRPVTASKRHLIYFFTLMRQETSANKSVQGEIDNRDTCDVERSTKCATLAPPTSLQTNNTSGPSVSDDGSREGDVAQLLWPSERSMSTPPPHEQTDDSVPVLVPVSESCESTPETPRLTSTASMVHVPILPSIAVIMEDPPTESDFRLKNSPERVEENSKNSLQKRNEERPQFEAKPSTPNSMTSATAAHRSPTSVPMAHISSGGAAVFSLGDTLSEENGGPSLPTLIPGPERGTGSDPWQQKPSHLPSMRHPQQGHGGLWNQQWAPTGGHLSSSPPLSSINSSPQSHFPSPHHSFAQQHIVQNSQTYQHQPPQLTSHLRSPHRNLFDVGGGSRIDSSSSQGLGSAQYPRGRARQENRQAYPMRTSSSSPSTRAPPSSPHARGNVPMHYGPVSPSQHMHHHQHLQSPTSGTASTNQAARTAPEILKTLLRKKACLYEAGTSRAIALITWLVGRELAMRTGYFSRQELQYGVHQVVASVIESGCITRTKVNRCMQIILNSCFHYIIPRPDGVETGDRFRQVFSETAVDDSHLLHSLPCPWNSINIDGAMSTLFLPEDERSHGEESGSSVSAGYALTPSTPRRQDHTLYSTDTHDTQDHDSEESGGAASGAGGGKRVVLLCFNENVRSFVDIFRCHNEFVRDVANAGNLELTAEDWRDFFAGAGVSTGLQKSASSSPSSSPTNRDLLSMQRSHEVLPELSLNADDVGLKEKFGVMSPGELLAFRTSWCCKRYDHDPALCCFAHAEINGGWLRRNPDIHKYSEHICPSIKTVPRNHKYLPQGCYLNACPSGVGCTFSHSREEVDYHPNRYKKNVCPSLKKLEGVRDVRQVRDPCDLRTVCPFLHPSKPSQRLHRRSDSGGRGGGGFYHSASLLDHQKQHQQHHARQYRRHHSGSSSFGATGGAGFSDKNTRIPSSAPMMYLDPAPESEFEKSLMFPGLRGLFRRHCSVMYSYLYEENPMERCSYSIFGSEAPVKLLQEEEPSL